MDNYNLHIGKMDPFALYHPNQVQVLFFCAFTQPVQRPLWCMTREAYVISTLSPYSETNNPSQLTSLCGITVAGG